MTAEIKTKQKTEKKVSKNKDTKVDRFKRIVSQRINFVIDRLAILGKVADNPQNYEFTEEQIETGFRNIEEFTAKIKQRFLDCIDVKEIKEGYKVDL